MENRSIDIRKQKLKEIEEIFAEPKKVKTVIKDPFNWKGASITLGLLLATIWSAYFVTIKVRNSTFKTIVAEDSSNSEKADNPKKTEKITPPELPTPSNNTNEITNDPFTPLNSVGTSNENEKNSNAGIDKNSFKIRILNGNGVVGDAAKIKTDLTSKGFNVGTVGNANLKYDKTQVYYIAGKQKEAQLVSENLTSKQIEQNEAEQSLVGSDYQILVVAGKL